MRANERGYSMDSGQSIVMQIENIREIVAHCIKDLAKKGTAKAEAERIYRIELAKEIVRQRSLGLPVTIIGDICRGNKDIAGLKFDRDVASDLYDIVKSKIYTSKLELEILITFFKSEYNNKPKE